MQRSRDFSLVTPPDSTIQALLHMIHIHTRLQEKRSLSMELYGSLLSSTSALSRMIWGAEIVEQVTQCQVMIDENRAKCEFLGSSSPIP